MWQILQEWLDKVFWCTAAVAAPPKLGSVAARGPAILVYELRRREVDVMLQTVNGIHPQQAGLETCYAFKKLYLPLPRLYLPCQS